MSMAVKGGPIERFLRNLLFSFSFLPFALPSGGCKGGVVFRGWADVMRISCWGDQRAGKKMVEALDSSVMI